MKSARAMSIVAGMAAVGGAGAAADPGTGGEATAVASLLAPTSILTATAGLIAFHIGLYTLVARERKSPYIINSVFAVFLLCLVIAAVALSSTLVPGSMQTPILYASAVLLVVAFLFSAYRVFRISVRFIYFVDSAQVKHFPVLRHIRRRRAMRSPRPNYAHNTIPVPAELKDEIIKMLSQIGNDKFENREALDTQALAVAVRHQGQANELLAELARLFLKAGFSVQYLTASRHPIEFVGYLKRHLEKFRITLQSVAARIVVIDAYSPHFAFIDSIYPKKNRELESLDVTCVPSNMTFAGMHSASSRAFNVIHEQVRDDGRKPTLVIYEDTYAISDLESPEQYRIFVRHVMPSERMWDGMFTVFVEAAQPDGDWNMLQSCASMTLDLRAGEAGVSGRDRGVSPNSTNCRSDPSTDLA
jgi:hypothetical protein